MNIFDTIYHRLYRHFGPQYWWPGETPEEIIIGAVLTQNTNWQNVSRAIDNLRQNGSLSLQAVSQLSPKRLAQLIRPSGYYNIKQKRLRAVADYFVSRWRGDLSRIIKIPTPALRKELLNIHGVGRETADSILLYALKRPVFVVDAYTIRIGSRHGLFPDDSNYEVVRGLFESHLKRSVSLFNEYHALLVRLGKEFCKPKSLCLKCPLQEEVFYAPFYLPNYNGTIYK